MRTRLPYRETKETRRYRRKDEKKTKEHLITRPTPANNEARHRFALDAIGFPREEFSNNGCTASPEGSCFSSLNAHVCALNNMADYTCVACDPTSVVDTDMSCAGAVLE